MAAEAVGVRGHTKAQLNRLLKGSEVAFIDFPEWWCETGKHRNIKKWLYEMRQAANAWEQDYLNWIGEFRMKIGRFAPEVFCGAERDIRCVVRGGDAGVGPGGGLPPETPRFQEQWRSGRRRARERREQRGVSWSTRPTRSMRMICATGWACGRGPRAWTSVRPRGRGAGER